MRATEAIELISRLAVAHPSPAWPEETMAVWAQRIADLEYADVEPVIEAMVVMDRPSSVGDIRGAVFDRIDRAPVLAVGDAWGCANYFARNQNDMVRRGRHPETTPCKCGRAGLWTTIGNGREHYDPLVIEAIVRCGWLGFTFDTDFQEEALRRRFEKAYEQVVLDRRLAHVVSPGLKADAKWAPLEQRWQEEQRLLEQRMAQPMIEADASLGFIDAEAAAKIVKQVQAYLDEQDRKAEEEDGDVVVRRAKR